MKAKNILKKAFDILATLFLIAVLGFTIRVLVLTGQGKTVPVFGKCVLKVETGSMEQTLHVGDFILMDMDFEGKLKVNDIIAFYSDDPSIKGMLVTHRIVGIDDEGKYITMGDANPEEDRVHVSPDRIEGKFVKKLRFYKWIGSFADRRKLLLLLVILPLLGISLYEVITLAKTWNEVLEERKKRADIKVGNAGETREEMIRRLEEEAVREYLLAHQTENITGNGTEDGEEKENG